MQTLRRAVSLAALSLSTVALAQVQVNVNIPVPTISFEVAPPVVEVQPGVQVVEDQDDEVFVHGGHYWVRRDGQWFRAKDGRRPQWARVEIGQVPVVLVQLPPGRYRRYKVKAAVPVVPAPAPAAPVYAPVPPPPGQSPAGQVLRVKTLRAKRIRARVIYAKEVKASDGRVNQFFEGDDRSWEQNRSDQKLELEEVVADVIYAKEVKAEWIEAGEVHAKEVKIGKRKGGKKHDDDDDD